MSEEITVTNDNFEEEVLKSDVPVLTDFWADWCVPCKMIAPVLEEISEEYKGKLKIGKVNVDDEGDLAMKFSVVSIPTLLLFKGGEVVNKQVGAGSKVMIEGMLKNHVQ
ncbi:MAG: thioredoxin [Spirochaetales bacterium]|nr:thioredoxin [Spirochaetales bacterium]